MNAIELRQRKKKLTDEANGLLAAELTDETRAKVDAFTDEIETINADLARAEKIESLTRNGQATPIDGGEERRLEENSAFALTREQRVADYVKRTTGADCSGFSLGRAIRGLAIGKWDGADAERRVMASSVGTTGGFLIPTEMSANVIDLARNVSVLVQAGVTTIPMATNNLTVARLRGDPTASWRGEGVEITETDSAFGAINLYARNLAALVRINNELLADAPNIAATIDVQLGAVLALELDAVGLYGNGVGRPLGIRHTDGVQEESMGTDGAAPSDYDDILDLVQKVEEANGTVDTLIYAPRTKNKLAKLVTGITSDKTKLEPPAIFTALNRLTSNQVSITETQGSNSDASTVFAGGFANCAFAIRQGITIEMSNVAGDSFAKNQTLIRAILRADFAIFRPGHLGRLIGVR